MLEPSAQQKGIVFVEIAVVEHQQELATIGIESLDRMRHTRREIPEVADANVIDESVPLGIDGRDTGGPVEHVDPFGSLVPMQLADATSVQAHVHAGDVLGDTELS